VDHDAYAFGITKLYLKTHTQTHKEHTQTHLHGPHTLCLIPIYRHSAGIDLNVIIQVVFLDSPSESGSQCCFDLSADYWLRQPRNMSIWARPRMT